MLIQLPPSIGQANANGTAPPLLADLKPGQVIEARFIGRDAAGLGQLRLPDGSLLKAQLPSGFAASGLLQLRVESREPGLVLKLLGAGPLFAGAEAGGSANPLSVPNGLAARLVAVSATVGAATQATALLSRRPAGEELAPQRSVRPQAAADDLEGLATALRLYAEAGKALASLPQAPVTDTQTPTADFTLKLPLQLGEPPQRVELQFSREQAEKDGEPIEAWNLRFAIELPHSGRVEPRLRFAAGRLALTLWADRPATAAALDAGLEDLRTALAADGIVLSAAGVIDGRAVEDAAGDGGAGDGGAGDGRSRSIFA